jgi:hypothetical protein
MIDQLSVDSVVLDEISRQHKSAIEDIAKGARSMSVKLRVVDIASTFSTKSKGGKRVQGLW